MSLLHSSTGIVLWLTTFNDNHCMHSKGGLHVLRLWHRNANIHFFFFCIYWLCAFIPDWLYAIRRELAFYGEKITLFLDFLIWACLCAHSLLGIYSVIWCYFIDFISSLQIILFVCGSKNRVKSVCVYEPAPRFCKRLFIINRNRYSAGKDHLLKNNQPDTKTNSAKKKNSFPTAVV